VDAELLTLRQTVCTASVDYYRAARKCYEATTPLEDTAVSEGIFLSAAGYYVVALSHLLIHLMTLEQTPSVLSETRRNRRLVYLLGSEVRATRRYIFLCPTVPGRAR
jgi:hypothetical protein